MANCSDMCPLDGTHIEFGPMLMNNVSDALGDIDALHSEINVNSAPLAELERWPPISHPTIGLTSTDRRCPLYRAAPVQASMGTKSTPRDSAV